MATVPNRPVLRGMATTCAYPACEAESTFQRSRGVTGVPNDSCDEYPFARSWQGGNDGAQCIDITPRQIGGVWDVAGVTVDRGTPPNAPCIRAHVDNKDNTAAGGELGRAVQADRILDSEWYQVIITPWAASLPPRAPEEADQGPVRFHLTGHARSHRRMAATVTVP